MNRLSCFFTFLCIACLSYVTSAQIVIENLRSGQILNLEQDVFIRSASGSSRLRGAKIYTKGNITFYSRSVYMENIELRAQQIIVYSSVDSFIVNKSNSLKAEDIIVDTTTGSGQILVIPSNNEQTDLKITYSNSFTFGGSFNMRFRNGSNLLLSVTKER